MIATSPDGAPMARAVADQDGQAKLAVPKTLYRASGQSPAPQYTITATLGGQNIEAQVASVGE